MSLLNIHETIIENPELITMEYFATRPKMYSRSVWYKLDPPMLGYTTYMIPICVIYKSNPHLFLAAWENQMIQIAAVKFTYRFDDKVLYYGLSTTHLQYRDDMPTEIISFRKNKQDELYDILNLNKEAILPSQLYKDVTSIISFETIIDGFKQLLNEKNFHTPIF